MSAHGRERFASTSGCSGAGRGRGPAVFGCDWEGHTTRHSCMPQPCAPVVAPWGECNVWPHVRRFHSRAPTCAICRSLVCTTWLYVCLPFSITSCVSASAWRSDEISWRWALQVHTHAKHAHRRDLSARMWQDFVWRHTQKPHARTPRHSACQWHQVVLLVCFHSQHRNTKRQSLSACRLVFG